MADEIIIGRNPVLESLRSGREIDTIYVLNNVNDSSVSKILGIAKDKQIPVRRVPRQKLDEMTAHLKEGNNNPNHQGIVARVSQIEYASLEDLFEVAESRNEAPFFIALDGITDTHNLGAIVRSAEVFGAHGVIIPKNRSASMNATAIKAACGAEEFIRVAKVPNLSRAIDELKRNGVFIVCADMSGEKVDSVNLTGAICIVIGSEGDGISRIIRDKADYTVKIEQFGQIDSLNASCAAAVLMYEKQRQSHQ